MCVCDCVCVIGVELVTGPTELRKMKDYLRKMKHTCVCVCVCVSVSVCVLLGGLDWTGLEASWKCFRMMTLRELKERYRMKETEERERER